MQAWWWEKCRIATVWESDLTVPVEVSPRVRRADATGRSTRQPFLPNTAPWRQVWVHPLKRAHKITHLSHYCSTIKLTKQGKAGSSCLDFTVKLLHDEVSQMTAITSVTCHRSDHKWLSSGSDLSPPKVCISTDLKSRLKCPNKCCLLLNSLLWLQSSKVAASDTKTLGGARQTGTRCVSRQWPTLRGNGQNCPSPAWKTCHPRNECGGFHSMSQMRGWKLGYVICLNWTAFSVTGGI